MTTDNPIEQLLNLTLSMHRHALANEWEMLGRVDKQRDQLLRDSLNHRAPGTGQCTSVQKINDLQTRIVNLASAERERLYQEYQHSRTKIQASHYYLSEGSNTQPRQSPVSVELVDNEVK